MVTSIEDQLGLDARPVTTLKGVGPRVSERLATLNIYNLQDFLFHLPRRYEDRTRVTPIGALHAGMQAVIEAEVDLVEIKYGRRRSLLVRISDGTGALTIRLFYFNSNQQQGFVRGHRFRFFGDIRNGSVTLEMVHPEYQRLQEHESLPLAAQMTPVYPTTEGVSQILLRRMTDQVLQLLDSVNLPDLLPGDVLSEFDLTDLHAALRYVHRPPPGVELSALEAGRHPNQQRLAFEELLAHYLSLRRIRDKARLLSAPSLEPSCQLCDEFIHALPFQLTGAQRRVVEQIKQDLAEPHPMMRLVQGDVGSGKTVVAAIAALQAIASGYQVAIMAPTELLAGQHLQNFQGWFASLSVSVGWLSGKLKGKAREKQLQDLVAGTTQIVIGTHALFQEEVVFNRLGLVIIDEQHRFGVHQRLSLRDKGAKQNCYPHQLIMTATPIPRTLAMAVYADLDTSVIDELPPGRTPVQTVVIPDGRRDEVIERVRQACEAGRQAYWVCTLIEESEVLQCQAAEEAAALLTTSLPDLRIALVHGRLKTKQKVEYMAAFKAGEIDLLVATTVIEVGVDVPNASLMIIENAERLGLAQLHQLRGRVGRGSEKSSCVLMYHGSLSRLARERLSILRNTNDGFEVARRDLELRGPGEVLGTRQTGEMQFHIADLLRDSDLLVNVEQAGELMMDQYPDKVAPLVNRWLGQSARYGDA